MLTTVAPADGNTTRPGYDTLVNTSRTPQSPNRATERDVAAEGKGAQHSQARAPRAGCRHTHRPALSLGAGRDERGGLSIPLHLPSILHRQSGVSLLRLALIAPNGGLPKTKGNRVKPIRTLHRSAPARGSKRLSAPPYGHLTDILCLLSKGCDTEGRPHHHMDI